MNERKFQNSIRDRQILTDFWFDYICSYSKYVMIFTKNLCFVFFVRLLPLFISFIHQSVSCYVWIVVWWYIHQYTHKINDSIMIEIYCLIMMMKKNHNNNNPKCSPLTFFRFVQWMYISFLFIIDFSINSIHI